MQDLNDAIEEQTRILKQIQEDISGLRKSVASNPTDLDFQSVVQTLNGLLDRANQPPLSERIYRQWGITGDESMPELHKLVDEWLEHVNSRGKDEA